MEKKARHAIFEQWGPAELARELGDITPQAISQWVLIPVKRVVELERITGVSRHLLRPDIFGEPLKRKTRKSSVIRSDEVSA